MNIKQMNCEECFKAIDKIEITAQMNGKDLTAAQKKMVKALEAQIDMLTEEFCE